MSIGMRMSLERAKAKAEEFYRLLNAHITCERFEWAGSLRRQRADVGDFDAVVIPRMAEVPSDDMFGTPVLTNLLWRRVEDLVKVGEFARHVKETAAGEREKWGQFCRAIEWRGCCVEIQLADVDNWAGWLAVRTGPGDMSKEIVTRLPRYNYAARGGFYIWDTKAQPAKMVKAPTEEQIFKFCGLPFLAPEKR